MKLNSYLRQRQTLINRALSRYLPKGQRYPGLAHQAMRYSVLGKGKRIRPILTLAACEATGGKVSQALHAACALELIHAYSLVHDDLPAMDDDDFRRGKPSCHKKFGEAMGVLTGDALLTFAFELLTAKNHPPAVHLKVVRQVAQAIGTDGMIGGQVADVTVRGRLSAQAMVKIHNKKTGALMAASTRVGALLGGATPSSYRALSRYGEKVGLVFQLVDDLLDRDGAVRLYGAKRVRAQAERLTHSAVAQVCPLGKRAEPLAALARFILTRNV